MIESIDTAPAVEVLQRIFVEDALAEIDQVPQEQLEAVYAEVWERVVRQDFAGALGPLLFLVVHDPYEFRFQFSYGLCLQQEGRVADAARHYGLAWMLDPSDPACAYRLGECHAALGDRDAAAEAFETAIALCAAPRLNADVRLAAEGALQKLRA
ncbi:tetratricopeptide repeat protein [Caenimonas koreensis]|uniref:Tetratricopeptide repeat protein n=1 Tax=Caenimonas koreensis DSM 17982 TaxID=1121255 RepID=A0A844B6Q4_9BURK|nr:tetratricopeptide repeat protein [Caenimonas koreensis]MRD47056.1 tetratricopeptide repeat protein [Caenimonas koreensis DSM 17982]